MRTRAELRFGPDDASFLQSVANILAVAIERKNAQERLERLAQFDSLTGLPNRHLFHDRLTKTMAHARRGGSPMAVLFIDLDRFKLVNDTQGHSAATSPPGSRGSSVAVRSGDTVGRFGGDEFGPSSPISRSRATRVWSHRKSSTLAQPFADAHDTT